MDNQDFETAEESCARAIATHISESSWWSDIGQMDDTEMIDQLVADSWDPPAGCDWFDVQESLAEVRDHFEDSTENHVRVSVDLENNGEEWWDSVLHSVSTGDLPGGPWADFLGRAFIHAEASSLLTEEEAEFARKWCESRPGWDSGDERAPHPIRFEELRDSS